MTLEFQRMPSVIDGQPPTWSGASYPFTFVVTQAGPARFVASARNVGDGIRRDLGAHFGSLSEAQAACERFIKERQK